MLYIPSIVKYIAKSPNIEPLEDGGLNNGYNKMREREREREVIHSHYDPSKTNDFDKKCTKNIYNNNATKDLMARDPIGNSLTH